MNLEENEKQNAKTGQARANVYFIGPQYDKDIPVKHRNNNSTNLSITKYIVIKVKIYVKNVFLSVFNNFKNLSIYFIMYPLFLNLYHIYILSYKIDKKTIVFVKKEEENRKKSIISKFK